MPRIREVEAYRLARGRTESVLVCVRGEDGVAGWGEAAASDRCWAHVERLGPELVGLAWELPEEIAELGGRHDRAAAAALDIACWDLWCRRRDSPLAHSLGGTRTSIVTGVHLGADQQLDTLLTKVNGCVGGGHARVTLVVRPGWDIEPVRAVRHAFPALALQADAAGSYAETPEHLTALEALDAYGLLAIERPFPADDLGAHARLQRQIATPVCLDLADLERVDAAIAMAAGRMLALRIARLGGLTTARAAHDRALASGWGVWCADTPGFGVDQAATVALASLPGCDLPSDVTGTPPHTAVVTPPVRANGGVVAVPLTQPGLGHRVDQALIDRLARRRLRIPA